MCHVSISKTLHSSHIEPFWLRRTKPLFMPLPCKLQYCCCLLTAADANWWVHVTTCTVKDLDHSCDTASILILRGTSLGHSESFLEKPPLEKRIKTPHLPEKGARRRGPGPSERRCSSRRCCLDERLGTLHLRPKCLQRCSSSLLRS